MATALDTVEAQAAATHSQVSEAAKPRGPVTRRDVRRAYKGSLKQRAGEAFMFRGAKSRRVQARLQDQLGLDPDTAKKVEQRGKHVRKLGEPTYRVVSGRRGRGKLVRHRSSIGSIAAAVSQRRRITATLEAANQAQATTTAPTPIAAPRHRVAAADRTPAQTTGRGRGGMSAAAA